MSTVLGAHDGPTHDWSRAVDASHLAEVRARAATLAPGGAWHLVLEVVAYAAEEAEARGAGRCRVVVHADGAVSVADDGRGTETRVDDAGHAVRKPVMATRDVRLFDSPDAPALPDGAPRRGMSVVAALSASLVHLNRRREGGWTQRYEHGVPVTDLVPVPDDGTTGTTVTFRPDAAVLGGGAVLPRHLPGAPGALTTSAALTVELVDERPA